MTILVDESKKIIRKTFLKHKMSLLKSFDRNPYEWPNCGKIMNKVVLIN